MDERRRDIALFGYTPIREAADAGLTPRERGELVRTLAARDHIEPGGAHARVARPHVSACSGRRGERQRLSPTRRGSAPPAYRDAALAERGRPVARARAIA